MTREEALKTSLYWNVPLSDVKKHIDKIYDSFEARACSNCEYKGTEDEYSWFCTHIHFFINSDYKDFGCNMFKLKENNNE